MGNTAQFAVTYLSQDGSNHSSDWEWARHDSSVHLSNYRFQGSTTYWTMSFSPDTIGARIEDELEFANAVEPSTMHGAHVNVWFDLEKMRVFLLHINLTQEEANHIEGNLAKHSIKNLPIHDFRQHSRIIHATILIHA